MKNLFLPAAVSVLFAVSCAKTDLMPGDSIPQNGVTVAFCTDNGSASKSHILQDGLSSEWEKGDCLVLWAENTAGNYTLDAVPFEMYGYAGGKAIFTATLPEAMPAGTYNYMAASPAPLSVNGTVATFEIPSVQDGKVSGGADILVGEPVAAGALDPVQNLSDYTRLGLRMEHLLHHFRFFIQPGQNPFGTEEIEKIVLEFSEGVTGQITTDLTDPLTAPEFTPASSAITLDLSQNHLAESTADEVFYACTSLRPGAFAGDATMTIKSYTATRYGISEPVSLAGRTFESGHSTPVRLTAENIYEYGRIRFAVTHNNIGEPANSITLTAPEGCIWGEGGSNVYVYNPGHSIDAGESFELQFMDIAQYRAFSGKTVNVSFDTEHVTYSENITMPDMSSSNLTEISSGLPYLLEEDFSNVESFSSNDEYSSSKILTGDKAAHSFLSGWTGGRIGAELGKCVRMAARSEVGLWSQNRSQARLDSAPILALKKPANIELSFDYGDNNSYSASGDHGQTVYVGYVTSDTAFSSDKTDGTYDYSFFTFEKDGSYDNTPRSASYVLQDVPAGLVRISWRTEVEKFSAIGGYTTSYLYIDNIKVRIKSN